MRANINSRTEREILFRNEAVCCVCQKTNIQIHHIDGNNSNNELKNLAVLCLDHHDRASSKSSMTRTLTPALIRQFKNDWERRVTTKRASIKRFAVKIKEEPFVKFEIKRLIFSLPAFKDKRSTNSIFDQLYNWHLFTGYTRNIFDSFELISWFLGDEQVRILLDRLYEYFWHLIGPKDVSISQSDKRNLAEVAELIGHLGVQSVVLNSNPKVFDAFFYAIDRFIEISQWYNLKKISKIIKNALTEVRNELLDAKNYPERRKLLERISFRIKKI